jgi:FkbM family methyltransferase
MKSTIKKFTRVLANVKIDIYQTLKLKKSIHIKNLYGEYLLPIDSHDDLIVNYIKNGKIFDSEVIDSIKRNYAPGSILDIGANFGQMSIELGKFLIQINSDLKTNFRVYSFEANPDVFPYLKHNLHQNCGETCSPVFGAVWNHTGETLYFPKYNRTKESTYGTYHVNLSGDIRPITTISIDSLHYLDKISVIKTDIQGADLRALKGAKNLILRDTPIIICEYETRFAKKFGETYQDYVGFFDSINYKIILDGDLDLNDQNFSVDILALPN